MKVLKAYFCLIDMGEAKDVDLPKEKQLFLPSENWNWPLGVATESL